MKKPDIYYWLPRIMAIFYIGFLGLFALDVFISGQTPSYYIRALLMHLLPNILLATILIVGWKNERWGASLFAGSFLLLFGLLAEKSDPWIQLLLFSPLLIISGLFLLHAKESEYYEF